MSNKYKSLRLDRSKIFPCLQELGLTDCVEQVVAKGRVLTGVLDGGRLRINVFENTDGLTTLGYSAGFDRATYDAVAEHI